jgi:dTDP-4-amino-4,6-dideoxygalactose transaminase
VEVDAAAPVGTATDVEAHNVAPDAPIPLSDVQVDDELVDALSAAIASGWWSAGPRVQEFEQAFAEYTGAREAVAVANGTAALHVALSAAGCGRGDEVVLPSLTFVAAANVVRHLGAEPVLCDVLGAEDPNLDPADLEAAITPRTKALLVLHYGGHPCDMDAVLSLADERGLVVIEDAAHAPGARWRGRACGTLGTAGCFSFFSNKNLPIGEGGIVVTDDEAVAGKLRLLRSHGMTTLTWDRARGHASTYDVVLEGFNYRLDDLRAAIALVQLDRLDAQNEARRWIVERYRRLLADVDGLVMPFADAPRHASSVDHLAVVLLPEGTNRPDLQTAMREVGVQTSVHYPPIHTFSAYAGTPGAGRPLPRTDAIAARLLSLPLYPHMREDQVDRVAATLRTALRV